MVRTTAISRLRPNSALDQGLPSLSLLYVPPEMRIKTKEKNQLVVFKVYNPAGIAAFAGYRSSSASTVRLKSRPVCSFSRGQSPALAENYKPCSACLKRTVSLANTTLRTSYQNGS